MKQSTRIVTVTINPAIDLTIHIPNFKAGWVNRVKSTQADAGGKGINVASFLADYGLPATVTGFLGAENDKIFCQFFERKGIEDRFVRIPGETRTGIKIIDDAQQQTTDINFAGETPRLEEINSLFEILKQLSNSHEWFVLAGSVPGNATSAIYRDLLEILAGKKAVLDTSGSALRQAMAGKPWMIKPNLEELQQLTGASLDNPVAILQAAQDLIRQYEINGVVVSLGKDGAIFVEPGDAVWAIPPAVEVKSTVGAGDALVAGFVAGKLQGLSLPDCARLAIAFSMVAISHIGSGLPSVEAVEEAKEKVTVKHL